MKESIKNDITLISLLLTAGLMAALLIPLFMREGERVCVRVDGRVIAEYPLSGDETHVIETPGGKNLLRIEGGSARIEEADCPDRLCVKMGRISRGGQTVVCLPHRVVVEIVSGTAAPGEPDTVAR